VVRLVRRSECPVSVIELPLLCADRATGLA
jgi:hypothetical protein